MKMLLEKKERKIQKLVDCVNKSEENQRRLIEMVNELQKEMLKLKSE